MKVSRLFSELEKGTTFIFTLPAKTTQDEDKEKTENSPEENKTAAGEQSAGSESTENVQASPQETVSLKTVLIAEDTDSNYILTKAILGKEYHLERAKDGMEAVNMLNGEYLGWHSKNLRLVNCRISGTQPLCYAHDLVMENCTMAEDADLAFEHSSVKATIKSPVHSVKNPRTGSIVAESFGAIILDENLKAPGNCELKLWDDLTCFN